MARHSSRENQLQNETTENALQDDMQLGSVELEAKSKRSHLEGLKVILDVASTALKERDIPLDRIMLLTGLTEGRASLRLLLNHLYSQPRLLDHCVQLFIKSENPQELLSEMLTNLPPGKLVTQILQQVCKVLVPEHPLSTLSDVPDIYLLFSAFVSGKTLQIDKMDDSNIKIQSDAIIVSLENPLVCWSPASLISDAEGRITMQIANDLVTDDTGILPPALLIPLY